MDQRTMELVLKYYRKKYCLSQEEVCDGLCSVATLSRLEQGEREIDSLLGQALLGRLGKEVTLFETILNEEDLGLWKVRTAIENDVKKNEYEAAKEKIGEYRKIMPETELVHEQFCLYQESLMMEEKNEPTEQLCETLERAVRLTISDFGTETRKKRLYSPIEIEMIRLLFHYDFSKENISERELLKVLDYVETYYSGQKMEQTGTKILLELIFLHKRRGDHQRIMLYTDKAIDFISRGTGFFYLADLYFLRAKTRGELFLKKSAEECKIAYNLYLLEEKKNKAEEVKIFCEEVLKCPITEPVM